MACSSLKYTNASENIETQFVAMYHVEDRCGVNHCVDCRLFRQDRISLVTVTVG